MAKKSNDRSGLRTVLLRNLFYRDSYRRIGLCIFLMLIINGVLIAAIVYKYSTPPPPQYFPATSDGRIIQYHPLTDPVKSDAQVINWVQHATQIMYEMDYLHWKDQLQRASNYFTPEGWRSYTASLKASNNINTLTSYQMISQVELTGVPYIINKGVVGSLYLWSVKVPVLLKYISPVHTTIDQTLDITFIITRVPVQDNPDRIAIRNFLPQTSGA